MDSELIIIFVAIGFTLGGFAFLEWYFADRVVIRRKLKARRRVDIGGVAEGATVRIAGRASYLGEPLEAPVSGRRCVYWEVVIERRIPAGPSGQWLAIVDDHELGRFALDDGTGRAVIESDHPKVARRRDARVRTGTFDDAPHRIEMLLTLRGFSSKDPLGPGADIRFREGTIEAGEMLSALGQARLEPDPDGGGGGEGAGGYREAPARVVLCDPAGGAMLLSDDPSTMK